MHIEEQRWNLPHPGQERRLKVNGTGEGRWAFPLFPGRCFDLEDIGMIAAIDGFIDGGKIKSFRIDGIDEAKLG